MGEGPLVRGYFQSYRFPINHISQPSPGEEFGQKIKYPLIFTVMGLLLVGIVTAAALTASSYISLQRRDLITKMKVVAETAIRNSKKQCQITSDTEACIVFTDIQSSTVLRDLSSSLYYDIILVHDATVRKLMRKHMGIELATEGDGFVIWFPSVAAGALFSMELQQELMDMKWSPPLANLCTKAYGRSRALKEKTSDRHTNGMNVFQRFQKNITACINRFKGNDALYNGPRVRCGVHVLHANRNIVDNIALGLYSFSGPDFNKARLVCDCANGGQILVSEDAQQKILEDLNGAHFPLIWHWGAYVLDPEDAGGDEDEEKEHIYEIASCEGVIKHRYNESLRNAEIVSFPGSDANTNLPPENDAVIVCASCKDGAVNAGALQIADRIFSDMQKQFWGWRIVDESMANEPGGLKEDPKSLSTLKESPSARIFKSNSFSGRFTNNAPADAGVKPQPNEWYYAFANAENALRFALCCQLELVYTWWPRHIHTKYKKMIHENKAPLWFGLPVAISIHCCKAPHFRQSFYDRTSGRTLASSLSRTPEKSPTRGAPKLKLVLCNPSDRSFLLAPHSSVAPTLSILRNVACDGQIVVTSDLLKGMTTHVSNLGGPVVEQLGKVHISEFDSNVYLYQVLPHQLAARSFPRLVDVLRNGRVVASGAKCAPKAKPGLTFVFNYLHDPEGKLKHFSKESASFTSDSALFDDDFLQRILRKYGGYFVDEVRVLLSLSPSYILSSRTDSLLFFPGRRGQHRLGL